MPFESQQSTTQSALGDGAEASVRSGPHLFLVIESHAPHAPAARLSLSGVSEVHFGRGRARSFELDRKDGGRLSVHLTDPWWSSSHARMKLVLHRWVLEDLQSKNGTLVNGVRIGRADLADGDTLEIGHALFVFRQAVPEVGPAVCDAASSVPPSPAWSTMVPALAEDLARLARLAPSAVPIVLLGETGVGKEVAARTIHALSHRPGGFVAVNCGAIPKDLVEAELFGHKKGAFSGATEDRPGLVRSADKGTLLLDEIGDLPASAQAALLRVLQEREVRPVGDTRVHPVDLRVIAATHRSLSEMVQTGAFRADLFARLSGHTAELWPLRRRREDMGILVAALLSRLDSNAAQRSIDPRAARALLSYSWPGNVRELEKALETAVVLAAEGEIKLEHLPPPLRSLPGGAAAARDNEDRRRREQLVELLRAHGGNVAEVARAMGKGRTQIQRWMARYDLDPNAFRR